MRVGFLRFTQNFDIDFLRGSAGTKAVELRLGILEGLTQLGHTPYILNNVPKDQQHLLAGGQHDGYNYDFLLACEYHPEDIPAFDLLIVEGAVDNIQFGINPIKRFVEVLKKYAGPAVAYHHGDQNCSVPIGEIYRANKNGPDPDDPNKILYRNIFQGIPWRDQWSLWTPGDPDRLRALKSERRGYNLVPSDRARYFRLGYSPTFDVPRQNTEWDKADLIYVGAERNGSRRERLDYLYNGHGCTRCNDGNLSKLLYGNWSDPLDNFDFRGFVPGFGLVYSLLPMAEATVAVTDDWFINQGMITTRIIQGIRAGLLTLADRRMKPNILDYLPEDNLVDTHEEVHQKLDWWAKKDAGNRQVYLYQQSSLLQPWAQVLRGMGL